MTNLSARLATAHDQLVGAKKQRTEKRSVVDVNSKDLNEKVDVLQRVINIVSERFDADGRVLLQGVSRTEPVMHGANTALLQEQWSSKEQPEGVVRHRTLSSIQRSSEEALVRFQYAEAVTHDSSSK